VVFTGLLPLAVVDFYLIGIFLIFTAALVLELSRVHNIISIAFLPEVYVFSMSLMLD